MYSIWSHFSFHLKSLQIPSEVTSDGDLWLMYSIWSFKTRHKSSNISFVTSLLFRRKETSFEIRAICDWFHLKWCVFIGCPNIVMCRMSESTDTTILRSIVVSVDSDILHITNFGHPMNTRFHVKWHFQSSTQKLEHLLCNVSEKRDKLWASSFGNTFQHVTLLHRKETYELSLVLFRKVSKKRDVRALSFELWKHISTRHFVP